MIGFSRAISGGASRWLSRSRCVCYGLALPAWAILAFLAGAGESATRIALVVIGFSAIIFVHELGHFVAARLCSVKCEVFSIGIGPRMLGWKKGVGLSFGAEREPPAPEPAESKTLGEIEDEKYARKPLDPVSPAAGAAPPSPANSASTTIHTEKGPVEIHPDTPDLTGDILGKPTHPATQNQKPKIKNPPGDTDYRLSWLPLGGYVKMLGQDDMDPTALSNDPHAFNRRPIWQRMIIISAGVFMNLVFAAVVFGIVFHLGVAFPPAIIGDVVYDMPADKAGIQSGDVVKAIDDERPTEGDVLFMDVAVKSAMRSRGTPMTLEIQRDGKLLTKTVTPEPGPRGLLAIGVEPMRSLKVLPLASADRVELGKVDADLAKLRTGDTIAAVNGQAVKSYPEFRAALQGCAGKPARITFANDKLGPQELTVHTELGARSGVKAQPACLGLYPRMVTGETKPDSPAQRAGFKPGDVVVRILDLENPTIDEFLRDVQKNGGQEVSVTVLREGTTVALKVTPERKGNTGVIGLAVEPDYGHAVIASMAPTADSRYGQIRGGSRITAIDGQPIASWHQVRAIAQRSEGKTLQVQIQDPADAVQTVSVTVKPEDIKELAMCRYQTAIPVEPVTSIQRSSSVLGAMRMGMAHTYSFICQTYLTLRGLTTGTIPVDQVHGPLGIGKLMYDSQDQGSTFVLFLLAVISVNLAVANFLPLPIVDGGLFVLLVLEKIRGRPLPLKVLTAINMVGLCLLVGVFLFVTLNNDIGLFWKK